MSSSRFSWASKSRADGRSAAGRSKRESKPAARPAAASDEGEWVGNPFATATAVVGDDDPFGSASSRLAGLQPAGGPRPKPSLPPRAAGRRPTAASSTSTPAASLNPFGDSDDEADVPDAAAMEEEEKEVVLADPEPLSIPPPAAPTTPKAAAMSSPPPVSASSSPKSTPSPKAATAATLLLRRRLAAAERQLASSDKARAAAAAELAAMQEEMAVLQARNAASTTVMEAVNSLWMVASGGRAGKVSTFRDLHACGFRSLAEKTELLDLAQRTADARVVKEVVLFLSETLSPDLFAQMLLIRPEATAQYVSTLRCRVRLERACGKKWRLWEHPVVALYARLGRPEQLGKEMMHAVFTESDVSTRLAMIDEALDTLLKLPEAAQSAMELQDYAELLQRQLAIERHDAAAAASGREVIYEKYPRKSIVDGTVAETLRYCLFYHPKAAKSKLSSPLNLKERMDINSRRYTWLSLRARAQIGDWKAVQKLTEKKGFFGRGSSHIGIAPFVRAVAEYKGPRPLLERFVSEIEDAEHRFDLAAKHLLVRLAVRTGQQLRDQHRLRKLRERLARVSTERYADDIAAINRILADGTAEWRAGVAFLT
eukprot:PLAT10007.1.p1 GENE.PLAT10007.1~~PLAT10007.1.p1  ORF type:complete len:599 (+),score=186.55 PLAT10007.1:29-1825(+)